MLRAGRFWCCCSLRLTLASMVLVIFTGWLCAVYWSPIPLDERRPILIRQRTQNFNGDAVKKPLIAVSQLRPSLIRQNSPNFSADADRNSLIATGRVVDTPSCVIPDFDPYNSIIKRTIWPHSRDFVSCNMSWPMLTDIVDRQFVQINDQLKLQMTISFCDYQEIRWIDDDTVDYGPHVKFTDSVRPDADFVRVQCYQNSFETPKRVYTNFHALIRRKTDVERRCNEKTVAYLKGNDRSADDLFNVLMIGIDSTSRLNSIRRLTAVRQLILEHLNGVELQGYGRVGDNTYPNIMALLTGMYANERPPGRIDNAPFLWRPFVEAGYRTLYVEDAQVENHLFNIWLDDLNSPRGFSSIPTDYYFRPMSIAQNNDKNSDAVSKWDCGPACIGPKYETELILDWIGDYVKEMNFNTNGVRSPFFAFGFFSRVTHGDHNQLTSVDIFLNRFFQRLRLGGTLNNTVVVVFSDHGQRFGTTRAYTRMGWYEENTPMALVAMPQSFQQRYPAMFESLQSNAKSLTTPMDLHETIRRLLSVGRPFDEQERTASGRRGVSLLDGKIGDRSCEQASIAPVYCECLLSSTSALETDSIEVKQVAEQTVERMNNILATYGGSCASLSLVRVMEARVVHQTEALNDYSLTFYTLTYETNPGGGIFQAMVKPVNASNSREGANFGRTSLTVDIHGDVLRLNSYSKSAGCVHDVVHKKWCHCVSDM